MCGYARRHISVDRLRDFLDLIQVPAERLTAPGLRHYYPAFGGAADRTLDIIIGGEAGPRVVDATWWFDCKEEGGGLQVNNSRTTFNARNLASPYWRAAMRHHRGVFLATGIGEGKVISGRNCHFLVESDEPILLGCVYRPFANGRFSTAIITRDSHPRFEPYHDKAFPLMLPHDPDFIALWLSDISSDDPKIMALLERPRIFTNLTITPVKTFKDAKAKGLPESLAAD